MIAVTYTLVLDEPLLATGLDGEPNSAVSAGYLPGSALRGALIGRFLQSQGRRRLDSTDPIERGLFLDHSTCFLHAYPLGPDGARALPTPRSWFREKGAPGPYVDLAREPADADREWEACGSEFVSVADSDVEAVPVERQLAVHTQRARLAGRATDADGAVFRYEALAAGQRFGAAIVCSEPSTAESLARLLQSTETLALGRSRSAGYGAARVEAPIDLRADWVEAAAPSDEAGDEWILTFLSDAILRDERGQPSAAPEAIVGTLRRILGADLRCQRAFLAAQPVGGFNRVWGLPLPQHPAIAKGSVLVFAGPPPATRAAGLVDLVEHGLGERRAEGFGRVAIDWPGLDAPFELRSPDTGSAAPLVSLDPARPAGRLAQQMLARRLREQAADAIVAEAARLTRERAHAASGAQLGRLRAIVRDCRDQPPAEGTRRLLAYLQHARERSVVRRQLERVTVGGVALLRWLDEQVAAPVTESRLLGGARPLTLGGLRAGLDETAAYRLTLDLIDRVLENLLHRRETSDD